MQISNKCVKCPFCGITYPRYRKTVSETFIFTDDTPDLLNTRLLGFHAHYKYYPLGGGSMQNIDQDELKNGIKNREDGMVLYMCKCPSCGKTFSFIKKVGNQYKYEDKIVNISPTNVRSKNYLKYGVPKYICQDYKEACRILYLSPQASATLSRRVLEDILTDFFHIKDQDSHGRLRTLSKKLNILKGTKNKLSNKAIDTLESFRITGNAGAHMQVQKNKIVRVNHGEADNLIKMIEYLMKHTYVEKFNDDKIENSIKKDAENFKSGKK